MDAEKEKQVYLYLNSKVRYDMAFPCNFDFNIKGNISLCYSTNNQYSLHIWFQNTIIICIIIDSYHCSITVTFIIFQYKSFDFIDLFCCMVKHLRKRQSFLLVLVFTLFHGSTPFILTINPLKYKIRCNKFIKVRKPRGLIRDSKYEIQDLN